VIANLWHYGLVVVLMMTGLYIVIAKRNYVKKMMGLAIFQTSVIMLYVTMGKVTGGTPPIFVQNDDGTLTEGVVYSNPLPMVLMLTAIVVGVATMAVGLALVVRIKEAYGTVEDDLVTELNREDEARRHQSAAAQPIKESTS
jgi:multicomponent Na+:H+ antiporter subunit C